MQVVIEVLQHDGDGSRWVLDLDLVDQRPQVGTSMLEAAEDITLVLDPLVALHALDDDVVAGRGVSAICQYATVTDCGRDV